MSRTVIRLRARDQLTLVLEIPRPDGSTDVIRAEPERVRAMYDGLAAALPRIFARFEDPLHGERSAEFPYPTPVNGVSGRVPPEILAALDAIALEVRGGTPPVLLIAEDDPFPWEVVRPRPDSRMLGQLFDLARFDGICAELTVEVPGILVVAPTPTDDDDQCDVTDGIFRDQFDIVKGHFPDGMCELLDCARATRGEVLQQLGRDEQRIVHYMGHHFFDADDPGQSFLQLAGDERMSPLNVAEALGVSPTGPKWPWVFLNCCKATAVATTFGEAGTRWGSVLRDAGARVTIGPYWRVDKVHSVEVSKQFFQHVLVDSWTIGAAMREVRANPRPPTKTAYTLVGDPTMKVRVVSP